MGETFIKKLEEHADEATVKIILHLIERKIKYNQLKSMHFSILSCTILYCFFLFYLCYTFVMAPNNFSVMDTFSALIGTKYLLILMVIAAILLGAVKIFFEKKEKAENDFHNLRREFIDKSKELWNEETWHERHHIFQLIKNKYDINLYHESK